MDYTLKLGLGSGHYTGTAIPAGPNALPYSATSRWHPGFSNVTLNGTAVATASDLTGLANLTQTDPGAQPEAMTDGAGTPFWRIGSGAWMNVGTGLVASTRNITVLLVARVPNIGSTNALFGLGNVAAGTQVNTLGATMQLKQYNNDAGYLYAASLPPRNAYTIPGAQKQVLVVNCTATGTLCGINDQSATSSSLVHGVSGIAGAELGRYPNSTGLKGTFDLYEAVVFSPALSDTQAMEVSQSLMAAHGIASIDSQLVLEGDSITSGTGDVTAFLSCAAVLTDPGTSHIPGNWRVVKMGKSGNTISHLIDRRDGTGGGSWTSRMLPGGNVMAFEIGRNTWDGTPPSQDVNYNGIVSYLNTPTNGVLQQGWHVRAMANIAASAALEGNVLDHRARLRSAQFLSDTDSGAGGAHDGKVTIVSTDLIEHGGTTRFQTSADSGNTSYYAGDNTHPSVLGAEIRVTGGETPHYGVAWGL